MNSISCENSSLVSAKWDRRKSLSFLDEPSFLLLLLSLSDVLLFLILCTESRGDNEARPT